MPVLSVCCGGCLVGEADPAPRTRIDVCADWSLYSELLAIASKVLRYHVCLTVDRCSSRIRDPEIYYMVVPFTQIWSEVADGLRVDPPHLASKHALVFLEATDTYQTADAAARSAAE